ncbi:MAG: hypothetical protein HC888_01720 [Candidatus Competibacteraceae bacterium]|nr:hypothetical protein [Candidatus Competibacteraceae bacterium]
MKIIISEKAKDIKFDKKRMKRYWRKVYPKPYANALVGANAVSVINKIAKKSDLQGVKLKGRLKQTDDGFCYVDVPNSIIDAFYELVKGKGISKPPYFNREFNNIGAHISVMYGEEVEENGIEVKELGEQIEFTIGEFFTVNPEGWMRWTKCGLFRSMLQNSARSGNGMVCLRS